MNELVLKSTNAYPMHSLVEAALENQERLLRAGIARTQKRIEHFEALYATNSVDFQHRFERDEWAESLDALEWLGELKMLILLNQKLEALQGIFIED